MQLFASRTLLCRFQRAIRSNNAITRWDVASPTVDASVEAWKLDRQWRIQIVPAFPHYLSVATVHL